MYSTEYEKGNDKKICITSNYDHSNKSGMGVTSMNISHQYRQKIEFIVGLYFSSGIINLSTFPYET